MRGADGEDDRLSPRLRDRLRRELDRVQPRFSSPRYLAARRPRIMWRLAPAALAAAVVGMLALTAYAGSPNPVVWTERVVTVIHPAAASPTPVQAPDEHRQTPRPNPAATPDRHESPEPKESPEPRDSPEPGESPEPSDDHSASADSSGSDHGED